MLPYVLIAQSDFLRQSLAGVDVAAPRGMLLECMSAYWDTVYSTGASSATAAEYSWAAAANCSALAAVAEMFRSAGLLSYKAVAAVAAEMGSAGSLEMVKKVHSLGRILVVSACMVAAAKHQGRCPGNTRRPADQDVTYSVSAAQLHALPLRPGQPVGYLAVVDKVDLNLHCNRVCCSYLMESGSNLER